MLHGLWCSSSLVPPTPLHQWWWRRASTPGGGGGGGAWRGEVDRTHGEGREEIGGGGGKVGITWGRRSRQSATRGEEEEEDSLSGRLYLGGVGGGREEKAEHRLLVQQPSNACPGGADWPAPRKNHKGEQQVGDKALLKKTGCSSNKENSFQIIFLRS